MPTYVLPQTLVFQDFQIAPAVAANPLRAHISGGHAFLIRYSAADERDKGRLGYYDPDADTDYAWPNRPAGGIVDTGFVKVWMKDGLLQYFQDVIGSGSVITKAAGANNKIHSATVNFATNGSYARHSSLYDRDVKPGDIVKLRVQPTAEDPLTMWTYVKSLKGDNVSAEILAATKDTGNVATQSDSNTITKTAGAINCVSLAATTTGYNGLGVGVITETYTIKVTTGSIGGDYTTARLRVLSASGKDDVGAVTPAAAGSPFDLGTLGATATFSHADAGGCSTSADNDSVSAIDLIPGQEWTVLIHQAFTAPTPTASGDYDNDNDTTYIIEVTKGGLWAANPQIMVTTTNGVDLSGPTTVTNSATAVPAGSKGVLIAFSSTGLRKGDRYYIECTGIKEGPMRNIILGHNIPSTVADDTEVDLTLFIRNPLMQISQNREGFAPLHNWDTSETQITLNEGLIAYDESWTDEGVPLPLDVISVADQGYGVVYVEYRAWLSSLAHEVGTIYDVGDIDTLIPGVLDPANPLKWGVFKALSNANGTEVKFTAVVNPDVPSDWTDVLEILLGREDIYGLVPLTRNSIVTDAYQAHVGSMSSPEQGLWRVLWVNLEGRPVIPVVSNGSTIAGYISATTTDGELALATFSDDPDTTGNQYTIVQIPAGNAGFLQNGVRPGDIVRALFVGDGFGNFTWSEYIVDEVTSEDELRLLTGPAAPQTVPAKIEVWRNLTPTEEATQIGIEAGAWGDRRVRAIWPDQIESGGTIQEGFHLCAALAGLSSGILPHQGMTRLEIAGFTSALRTTSKFNRPQLDIMALAGTWIVTQDLSVTSGQLGKIFTRHAVTTGAYADINAREEMIIRNVDSISYRFKDNFEPFIGITNVTPSMESKLRFETLSLIEVLKSEAATIDLGGQLISAVIVRLSPHLTIADRFVLVLSIEVPVALNNFEIHLVL